MAAAWTTVPSLPAFPCARALVQADSDRVTITWDDNGIQKNQWLQVTVKADGNTGLAAADVFYFGNAIGESGDNPANAVVDSQDEIGSRTHKTGFTAAAIDNPYDYNRDGKVNATDDLIARNNASAELQLISAPVGGALVTGSALQPAEYLMTSQPVMTTIENTSTQQSSTASDVVTSQPASAAAIDTILVGSPGSRTWAALPQEAQREMQNINKTSWTLSHRFKNRCYPFRD